MGITITDDYIESIFNKKLNEANPEFVSSYTLDGILCNPEEMMPSAARKLYSFVKFCKQEGKENISVCVEIINALKRYERRRLSE